MKGKGGLVLLSRAALENEGSSSGANLKPPARASSVLSEEDEGLLAWIQMTQVDS